MADNNKVLFGFSELHIGTYSVDDEGNITLGTPYHQKGGVGFSPETQSEKYDFYADNVPYFSTYTGGTKEGDLEVAKFDDDFKIQFLGYKRSKAGGLAEIRNATKPNIYAAFQIEGDQGGLRVIMYNGTLGTITRSYTTTEEGVEVATETIAVTFNGAENGLITDSYYPGDDRYDTLFESPPLPEFEDESE